MTRCAPPPAEFLDVIGRARAEGRDTLLEPEAAVVLEMLGIRRPAGVCVGGPPEDESGSEEACSRLSGDLVVVKVVAARLSHKSDRGGVRIVPKRATAIREAMASMRESLADCDIRGFMISEFVEHGSNPAAELLIGARWTDDFGPVVSIAPGGVFTEYLARSITPGKEVAIFAPGLACERTIDVALGKSFIGPLVAGAVRRQAPLMGADQLHDLLRRFLRFAADHIPHDVREIEINPLVPTMDGGIALDTRVQVGRAAEAVEPERPLEKIHNLLEPKSIAVIGVSRAMNPGHVIVANLLREGFDRDRIWIVKPGESEIDGCRCFDDIESLPERVDLLVLSVSAEQIPDYVARAVASRKAESMIVIPGGMGEHSGSESLEESVRESIRSARHTDWKGPVVNGGNCLGIRSLPGRYDTIFLPQYKLQPTVRVDGSGRGRPEAPVAVVSQSGAFAVSKLTKLGMSPRYLISIGNQVDLTVGDYMEFLEADPSIDVFAFYVEGFRPLDGRRWLAAASRATSTGRPVILYRAGRTDAGAKATATHTAAIAGDAVVSRELATQAGVIVADSIEEFEDLVRLFSMLHQRSVRGLRLAAMSNAGFESVAFADNLGPFSLSKLTGSTRERIAARLRESRLDRIVTIVNPLDVNPLLSDEPFAACAADLIEDPDVDLAVIGCVPLTGALQTLPADEGHRENALAAESVVSRFVDLWQATRKPWILVFDAGSEYDLVARRTEEAGIPTFRSADRAMRVFGRFAEWSRRWRDVEGAGVS
jgi:acyl-CoA synthetase (NDP forming)